MIRYQSFTKKDGKKEKKSKEVFDHYVVVK
jgi:hypothetical protein